MISIDGDLVVSNNAFVQGDLGSDSEIISNTYVNKLAIGDSSSITTIHYENDVINIDNNIEIIGQNGLHCQGLVKKISWGYSLKMMNSVAVVI